MRLRSSFWDAVRRLALTSLIVASLALLVFLGVFVFYRSICLVLEESSPPEAVGSLLVAVIVLFIALFWEQMASRMRSFMGKRRLISRQLMRAFCLLTFFPVLSLYFLTGGKVGPVPAPLEVGVIAVSITLGGLVLNAGLNRGDETGREFIVVAQKFVAVVILMLIFLPTVHIVDLAGDIDVSSFEPSDLIAWGRGLMFLTATTSFYAGTGLFVIALFDLAYVVFGLGETGNASHRKCESPDRSEGCGDAGTSA